MGYKIKAWFNTGFTASNPPDSEAKLDAAGASRTFPELNILSNAWRDDVTIEATKAEVALLDFIKIWDPDDTTSYSAWYYYVSNSEPVQAHAQKLALTSVYLLIAGGVSNIDFITGFLERKSPDKNQLCEQGFFEDELMAPSHPLHVDYRPVDSVSGQEVKFTRLTATRIDLGAQSYYRGTMIPIDKTVTDLSGETTTVNKEKIGAALSFQTFTVNDQSSIGVGNQMLKDDLTPYVLYMGNQQFIDDGINALRGIGAEGAILASYYVPSKYIGATTTVSRYAGTEVTTEDGQTYTSMRYGIGTDIDPDSGTLVKYALTGSESQVITNYIKTIHSSILQMTTGDADSRVPGIRGKYYSSITNKCLLLGAFNRYGIITDGNNRIEVAPERMILGKSGIYGSISDDDTLLDKDIVVASFADLRPDGKPYYYFTDVDGNTISSTYLAMIYGVAGAQWQACPISWTDVSGGKLLESQYKNTVSSQQLQFTQSRQGAWTRFSNWLGEKSSQIQGNAEAAGITGNLLGTAGTAAAGAAKIGAGAAAGTATAAGISIAGGLAAAAAGIGAAGLKSYQKIAQSAQAYALEQAQELSSYMTSVGVAVPEISFIPQATPMRDLTQSSAILYKYSYDYADIERIDKMLTAFGWKTCVVPKKSDLNSHVAFDYLKGSVEVKATGNTPFPRWLADGISAELSAGVRIWHQSPIEITADCNPVKE